MPLPSLQPLLLGVKKPLLVGPPPPPPPAAPFLLAGGSEFTITAGAAPRTPTLATAPVGSTIVVALMSFDGTQPTGFVAGSNSFNPSGVGPLNPFYGAFMETYQCAPLTTALAAGSNIGPNLDGSGRLYMLVFCIPGATARDPEAASLVYDSTGDDVRRATVPAWASAPQVASIFIFTTSNGTPDRMVIDPAITQLGGDLAMDSNPGGSFGIKGGYVKLTAPGGPADYGVTFTSGSEGGTAGITAQRTTSVIA